MNEVANSVMLDESFQAALQRYAQGNGSSAAIAAAAVRAVEARASLSTSKQAGAEPVFGWQLVPVQPTEGMLRAGLETDAYGRDNIHSWDDPQTVYRAMLAAAPGAAIAAREQEAEAFLRQMASLPGTFIRSSRDLSPQAITEARASNKWLALRDGLGFAIMAEHARQAAEDEPSACAKCSSPDDCGRLGCAAIATPPAAIPAAPSEVTDAQIIEWAIEEQFLLFCDEEDVIQIVRSAFQKWPTLAALTQPTTVQQAEVTDEQIQAAWDEACKDSPQKPGWCRHIRFARAVLALKTAQTTALPGAPDRSQAIPHEWADARLQPGSATDDVPLETGEGDAR